MSSYLEDIAAMRQERAQREAAERVQDIRRDYADTQRERDAAYAQGDADTFNFYDRECERLEREYYTLAPPQQPQPDPGVVEFVQRNKPWFDKHGMKAFEALNAAHAYATRPRDPSSTNPANTGMGLSFGTPQYYGAIKDLLHMYAADYGMPFNSDDELLTPDDAAEISGLSAKEYNRGVKQMVDEGRHSATESDQMWGRKVG